MNHRDSMIDPRHLRTSQYVDDTQLRKRIAIHDRFSTSSQNWCHWLFEQIAFPRRPRTLELGCGTGLFWNENRHRLPGELVLTLTDISEGMLQSARTALQGISFESQIADAQSLPFADASFDLVIANHMLYHVPDIALSIQEIRRVLVPGGCLYAATNGIDNMREMFELTGKDVSQRPVATRFSLENGAAQIEGSFDQVERRDFPCDLAVTEVQPVIDYLESTALEYDLTSEQVQHARDIVADAIAQNGAFRIRKSAGVLIAR